MNITLYIEGHEMETISFHNPARQGDEFSLVVPNYGDLTRTYRVTLVDKDLAIAEWVRTTSGSRTTHHKTHLE